MLYKARKSISDTRIRLDLTKGRYRIYKEAREKVANNSKVKFVYTDINCRLKLHPTVGKQYFFNTIEELEEILQKLE